MERNEILLINEVFLEPISSYSMFTELNGNNYSISNEFGILNFYKEPFNIECTFMNQNDIKKFDLLAMPYCLCHEKLNLFDKTKNRILDNLISYRILFNSFLTATFANGDTSWQKKYIDNDQVLNEIYSIFFNLEKDDLLNNKFSLQDLSWESSFFKRYPELKDKLII
jgi:hypothetical protein